MTFVEILSGNEQQDEYIKIDPNMGISWENIGDILCEHIAKANIKRAAEFTKRHTMVV